MVAVHDLHASTVSTGMPVVMAHVVVERGLTMDDAADILSQLQNCLREHFPVSVPHTTFQLEPEGYDVGQPQGTAFLNRAPELRRCDRHFEMPSRSFLMDSQGECTTARYGKGYGKGRRTCLKMVCSTPFAV